MPSDTELLLKKSRELIAIAKITVSESERAFRHTQERVMAMKPAQDQGFKAQRVLAWAPRAEPLRARPPD
ncbi:MAG TPA: hypothetical protein VGW77_27880 [Candidatus Binatia bacterium]|jgi:hypothetical protein|nr:hypothetical protein [Candidatus Binatia bacterium]